MWHPEWLAGALVFAVHVGDPPYDEDRYVRERIAHPARSIANDIRLPRVDASGPRPEPNALELVISPTTVQFPVASLVLDIGTSPDLGRLRLALGWARRHFDDPAISIRADAHTPFHVFRDVLRTLDKTAWQWRVVAHQPSGDEVALDLPFLRLQRQRPPVAFHVAITADGLVVQARGIRLNALCELAGSEGITFPNGTWNRLARCAASMKTSSRDFIDEREATISADDAIPIESVLDVAALLAGVFPIASLRD